MIFSPRNLTCYKLLLHNLIDGRVTQCMIVVDKGDTDQNSWEPLIYMNIIGSTDVLWLLTYITV